MLLCLFDRRVMGKHRSKRIYRTYSTTSWDSKLGYFSALQTSLLVSRFLCLGHQWSSHVNSSRQVGQLSNELLFPWNFWKCVVNLGSWVYCGPIKHV